MKVKILVSIVLALALVGAADSRPGGGSFSSGGRSSSSFSSRSYSSTPSRSYAPSVARPSTASPTFSRPAPSSSGTPPKIQAGTTSSAKSGSFNSRPSVSTSSSWGFGRSRSVGPGGVTVIHEHHYFGGGYGYGRGYYGGYSGGFGSSPFFWLWLLDRPQQQVYAQQPGYAGSAGPAVVGAPIVEHDSPGFFSQLFNILIGLLMIGVIVALVVWIVRKLIGINQADHTV